MNVRLIEGPGAIAALDDRWDALVARQPVPNPTLTSTWLRELVAWEPGVPLVAVAEADGRLLAAGAFGVRRPGRILGPRVATWLGTDNYWYSPDLLVDPEVPDAGIALMSSVLEHVGAVEISLPADGIAAATLRARLPQLHEEKRTDEWVTPLPPPRLEYAANRVAHVRRRAERRGAHLEEDIARSPDEVAAALERMFSIHHGRWDGKANAITRFSTTDGHREWYRRVIASMAAQDSVRIIEVREDRRLIASLLGLFAGSGAMLHLMAVDPGAHLRQPGHGSLLAWVNEAMACGATVMDLCWGAGGPNSPKSRLGPTGIPVNELLGSLQRADMTFLMRRRALARGSARARQRAARVRHIPSRLATRHRKESP
jgi:CelD/BcsL family acetyltransferase involved in cellulose biosynthesis